MTDGYRIGDRLPDSVSGISDDEADLVDARCAALDLVEELESLALSLRRIIEGRGRPGDTFLVRGQTNSAGETGVSACLRLDSLLAGATSERGL